MSNRIEITNKEEYEEAIRIKEEYFKEIMAPRCAHCEHNNFNHCDIFASDIPEEFVYAKTECEEYQDSIPF